MVVSRVAREKPIDDHGFAIARGTIEEQIGHAGLTRVRQQVTELGQDLLGAGVANPARPTDAFDALIIGESQGPLGRLAQRVDLRHRVPPDHQTVQSPLCRPARGTQSQCRDRRAGAVWPRRVSAVAGLYGGPLWSHGPPLLRWL